MDNFIHKLPIDIVLRIIPYTYNLQNKNLLEDIIHFKETKTKLIELYNEYWIKFLQSTDPEEGLNWLINDIVAYANNFNATMYGYKDNFYNIFKRNVFLQSKEKIDIYINNLHKKKIFTQINIYLGLLSVKERKNIIINFPLLNRINWY